MERYPKQLETQTWFKEESLRRLADQVQRHTYPGYPEFSDRLSSDLPFEADGAKLPFGPWETSGGTLPTIPEQEALSAAGVRRDGYGRPLHPWIDDMISNPDIGVVTGKGFYWNWGPNYTADPIVIRHDLIHPYVLLIKRRDTGQWALPGGFVDQKDEDSLAAAIREAQEETGIDLRLAHAYITPVYQGPLADPRVTANAWPETSAYCINLFPHTGDNILGLDTMVGVNPRQQLADKLKQQPRSNDVYLEPIIWQGGDDAREAAWVSAHHIGSMLFGSHQLLVQLALGRR